MTTQLGKMSTLLTQRYLPSEPVGAGGAWTLRKNSQGETEILTTGSDGQLHYFQRDAESETGWRVIAPKGIEGFDLVTVEAFRFENAEPATVYLLQKTSGVTFTNLLALSIDEESGTVSPSKRGTFKARFGPIDDACRMTNGNHDLDRDVFVSTREWNSGGGTTSSGGIGELLLSPEEITGTSYYSKGGLLKSSSNARLACSGATENISQAQSAFIITAKGIHLQTVFGTDGTGNNPIIAAGKELYASGSAICVVRNSGQLTNETVAFVVDTNQALQRIDSTIDTDEAFDPKWADAAVAVSVDSLGDEKAAAVSLDGIADSQGHIYLFLIDSKRVCWCSEGDGSQQSAWAPIAKNVDNPRLCLGANGLPELFYEDEQCLDSLHYLRMVDAQAKEWEAEQVNIVPVAQAEEKFEQVSTLAVSIPVIDENGVAQAGVDFEVKSGFAVDVDCNNQQVRLDPEIAIKLSTDETGSLHFFIPLLHGEGVPTLTLSSSDAGIADTTFDPRQTVTGKLSSLCEADITNYNQQNPKHPIAPAAGDQLASVSDNISAAFKSAGHELNTGSELAVTAFHVSRRDGAAAVTPLSDEDFAARKEQALNDQHRLPSALLAAGIGNSPIIDWPAIWRALREELLPVVEVAVKAAESVWTVVIKGVEYAFHIASESLDQAYQSLSAILVALDTALTDVERWLIDTCGRLLDALSLQELATQFETVVKSSLQSLPKMLGNQKPSDFAPKLKQSISSAVSQLNSTISQAKSSANANESVDAIGKRGNKQEDSKMSALDQQVHKLIEDVLGQFFRNPDCQSDVTQYGSFINGHTRDFTAALKANSSQLNSMEASITGLASAVTGAGAANTLNPASILGEFQSEMKDFSTTAEAMLDAALASGDSLLTGIDDFIELLEKPLSSPSICVLYKTATGSNSPPSFLNVYATLLAIGATLSGMSTQVSKANSPGIDITREILKIGNFISSILKSTLYYMSGQIDEEMPIVGWLKLFLFSIAAIISFLGACVALGLYSLNPSQAFAAFLVYGGVDLIVSICDLCVAYFGQPQSKILSKILIIVLSLVLLVVPLSFFALGSLSWSRPRDGLILAIDSIGAVLMAMRLAPVLRRENGAMKFAEVSLRAVSIVLLAVAFWGVDSD